MKARIAEVRVVGSNQVKTFRRATVTGTPEDVEKKLRQLSKGRYRSIFGAIDAKTGRLLDVRKAADKRGGGRTSRRVRNRKIRTAIGRLARETYGLAPKRKRSARKNPRRRTSRSSRGRSTARRTTRRRSSRGRRRSSRTSRARRTSRRSRARRPARRRTSRSSRGRRRTSRGRRRTSRRTSRRR